MDLMCYRGILFDMTSRVFNFYSGPATLPLEVLERARAEILSFDGHGASVMEISHRSAEFIAVLRSAESRLRTLLGISDSYTVLFLQGGATLQFSMVPMNFLGDGALADYIITGTWSKKALKTACEFGKPHALDFTASGSTCVPFQDELKFSENARYVHYVSNETIDGVEFPYDVDGVGIPVICDASSNILSRPIDLEKYAMIYAGAQKNIGPSGVTVAVIRNDMLETCRGKQSGVLSYTSFADNYSMPNTPNTWGIYIIDLVCEWLQERGGLEAAAARNTEKARLLYDAIDQSDGFYSGNVERSARSKMNVTFRLPSGVLENEFCTEAENAGMIGLRGHRTVGGIRASIYNAFPLEGVKRLVEHMGDFSRRKG
jgi:phosphoserine aminotransferase